jgi:hypothetical protein
MPFRVGASIPLTYVLPPLRFEGRYKRVGYHYPKSVVWQGHLYVGYSTHKETVDVARVPLGSLRR